MPLCQPFRVFFYADIRTYFPFGKAVVFMMKMTMSDKKY